MHLFSMPILSQGKILLKKDVDTVFPDGYNNLCQLKLISGVYDFQGYTRSHPEHDG